MGQHEQQGPNVHVDDGMLGGDEFILWCGWPGRWETYTLLYTTHHITPRAPSHSSSHHTHPNTRASSESDEDVNDPDAEEAFAVGRNNWSAVSRADRYRKRRAADGEDTSLPDDDNPLYDHIDPITLEPVVCPAISPYGHVMGMATWKAVLEESEQCPFTKQPLRVVQLKKLTKANIDAYRDVIVK